MTYREGDKIVVELSEDFAGYLNADNWFGVQRENILEHIKKPRPEPVVIFMLKDEYDKKWLLQFSAPVTDWKYIRKLTLTEDEDGNKTWTEEVIK